MVVEDSGDGQNIATKYITIDCRLTVNYLITK